MKTKFGNPAFLSIVAATLIIVAAIFATRGAPGKGSVNQGEPGPFWQKTTTDPVAAYTGVLAIFTFVLAAVSCTQIYFLQRSDATARTAANAAKTSADALLSAERAHVVEIVSEGDMHDLYISGEFYQKSPSMDQGMQPTTLHANCQFINYGKTPATIMSYSTDIIISRYAPSYDDPIFTNGPSGIKRLIKSTVPANEGSTHKMLLSHIVDHSWNQSQRLASRELTVWLIGHVTFLDVFKVWRTRKFIWYFDRPMREMVPAGYAEEIEDRDFTNALPRTPP